MNLEYVYFEDAVAEKLMEAFKLYGNRLSRYEGINPYIIYGIADKEKNLFFTRGFSKRNGKSQETEYIFCYGDLLGQVNCNITIDSAKIDGKWVYHVEKLEILKIKGNTEFDEIQAEEIIRFYEETNAFEFEQQLCKKLNLKSHFLNNLNVIRQHEIMIKNKHKWENMGELLAEDYIFEPLNETDKLNFMDCINKHSVDYSYFKNANMDYYMTDRNHSFKMIQCASVSEMIKRCGEPDDYEFAILTENTSGTVLVWNCDDFRVTNGEIPITHEKLSTMFHYYEKFYYSFTEMIEKNI
ncbi:MAG: hypothetical protein K2K91_06825 [Ruminococcus sp.]|nr:hypothetical protein [Ruminococcus sp.]MDE7099447.1 hypothetical protein [Ruminococcus sp.]